MAHENTPLLPRQGNRHHAHWILFLVCAIVVAVDFGGDLSIAPQTQILENIICHDLHPDAVASSSSSICKGADVQSELASINAWKVTFDQLPGIILALPFGFMADRVGRKKVVVLSLLGLMMQEVALRVICWNSPTIPPRAIWFTALFQICGGGSQIATSMAFTIMTDVYPVEKRTNIFFILAAAALMAEILANPISALLMSVKSPWLPYLLSLVCELLGLFATLALPETLPKPLRLDQDSSSESAAGRGENEDGDGQEGTFKASFSSVRTQMRRISELIWSDRHVLTISVAFLAANVGQQSLQLMLQYASKRFAWSMAKASILKSVKGTINLVLLLVVLPLLSNFLERRLPPARRDLLIAQVSAAFLVVGFTVMGLAPHPVLFSIGLSILALGWGFYFALRSVASALVSEAQIGLLNTTIALVQGVGGVVAGPALAGAFNYGLRLGGAWIGLPYLLAAGLFLCAGVVTVGVTIDPGVVLE